MPIFKINLAWILIFLLNAILIDSVIKYNVENTRVYMTIGLNKIEEIISKLKREIIALVPPQAGQNIPKWV